MAPSSSRAVNIGLATGGYIKESNAHRQLGVAIAAAAVFAGDDECTASPCPPKHRVFA
jgi:hypothetical protein